MAELVRDRWLAQIGVDQQGLAPATGEALGEHDRGCSLAFRSLAAGELQDVAIARDRIVEIGQDRGISFGKRAETVVQLLCNFPLVDVWGVADQREAQLLQIGRASCRERVCQYV